MDIAENLEDYEYHSQQIGFKLSDVCIEGFYLDQVVKLVTSVKTALSNMLELLGFKMEENNVEVKTRHDPELVKHLDSCPDDRRFTKLKYTTVSTTDHKYSEYYEEGVITDRILTEFILKMNSPKSSSKRNTTQFLDFLGSIGGI